MCGHKRHKHYWNSSKTKCQAIKIMINRYLYFVAKVDFYLLIRCSLPTTKRNKSENFDETDSSKLIQEVFLYFISCGIYFTWLLSWWIIILLNMQHKKKKKEK